jgi:hypothetical protein
MSNVVRFQQNFTSRRSVHLKVCQWLANEPCRSIPRRFKILNVFYGLRTTPLPDPSFASRHEAMCT